MPAFPENITLPLKQQQALVGPTYGHDQATTGRELRLECGRQANGRKYMRTSAFISRAGATSGNDETLGENSTSDEY